MTTAPLTATWLEGRVARLAPAGSLYWDLDVELPGAPEAEPGQFAMIAPGRLDTPPVDPLLPRPLSILHATPGRMRFLFKVFGRGTAQFTRLAIGAPLRVLAPLGRPFGVEASPHPFLVGGGVGIPPLHWLSRHLSERVIAHRVVFGFGSAAEIPTALLDELEQPVDICTLDGSAGTAGNPVDFLKSVQGHAHMRVQACGPAPMLDALKCAVRPGDLLELSLEERMACGVGICRGCVVPVKDGRDWRQATVCREGPVFDAADLAEVELG